MFSEINAVMPGFINIRLNPCYLASYVQQVAEDEKLGLNAAKKPGRSSSITAEPM